jgi:hypothetical protein
MIHLKPRIAGDTMQEYQSLWNSVRDELKNQLTPSTFEETFGKVKRTAKEENGLIYII